MALLPPELVRIKATANSGSHGPAARHEAYAQRATLAPQIQLLSSSHKKETLVAKQDSCHSSEASQAPAPDPNSDSPSTARRLHSGDQKLTVNVKDVFHDGMFTFPVGPEEKRFDIHQRILSDISRPFAALMGNGMKESLERNARLPEVEPATFALLLEYAYSGIYTMDDAPDSADAP